MKHKTKIALVVMVVLFVGLAVSCTSTGQYMEISKEETVIGTVQSTFVVRSSLFSLKSSQDAVNTQAYIHLLEEANKKYEGAMDIRDIVWVTGRSLYYGGTEISATGKVVQID